MKNCARFQLIPDQLFVTWNQLLTHISIEINVSSLFTLVEVSTLLLVRLSQLSSSAGSSLVCTDTSHNIVAGHWRRGVFGIGKMRSEASVAVLSQ